MTNFEVSFFMKLRLYTSHVVPIGIDRDPSFPHATVQTHVSLHQDASMLSYTLVSCLLYFYMPILYTTPLKLKTSQFKPAWNPVFRLTNNHKLI